MQSQDTLLYQQYLAIFQCAAEFSLAGLGLTYQGWSALIQGETKSGLADAAVLALRPLIEFTASRVCKRIMVRKLVGIDFIGESVAHVLAWRKSRGGMPRPPKVTKYNPSKGKFQSWLYTVLKNELKDRLRKIKRRKERENKYYKQQVGERPTPDAEQSGLIAFFDRDAPFTTRDVETMENFPVLTRVVFLAVSDLRNKLPQTTWQRWCQEASLPTPFPPENNIPHERGGWINLFAELLGSTPNALQMRFERCRKEIQSNPLDYIKRIKRDM